MSIFEHIISIIAPHECLECNAEGDVLCAKCAELLPSAMPRCYRCKVFSRDFSTCKPCRRVSSLKRVIIITDYDVDQTKKLIHGLKFGRKVAAARTISEIMTQNLAFDDLRDNSFTHVPTANIRVRARGYDQSREIARHLCRSNDLHRASLLLRLGSGRQVGRTREQRLQHMSDVFVVGNPELVKGRDVVLVDDIVTTGATLESAAKTLRLAGARSVSAVVFAAA